MKRGFFLFVIIGCLCTYLQAQSERKLDTLELDDVVITAQYAPTSASKNIFDVKVIKSKDIERQGQLTLNEVLTNQLNLRVSTDPILGNGLAIQGLGGQNVQIMIDGVPMIGRVGGNIDLSQINLQQIERIEIIEGAMSAQYGSNASGGVINLITKKGEADVLTLESQNQYENIGIQNYGLSLGLRWKKLYASIAANQFISEFGPIDSLRQFETVELPDGSSYTGRVIPWNPKVQQGINASLTYYQSEKTKYTYQFRQFDETVSMYGQVRRPQFRPYAIDENFHTLRTDHSLLIESYLTPQLYLKSTTGYNSYARLSETIRLDIEPDTTSLVAGEQDTALFTALLHRTSLSSQFDRKINGQIGIEVLHETGGGGRIIDSTTMPINSSILSNVAAWGSIKYQPVSNFTLQANLRAGYNTKYSHPLVPSIHAHWTPNNDWSVKLSYAHGFRAPTLKELHFNFIDINHYIIGNPDLKPENSQNASITTTYNKQKNHHRFSLKGKLFYNSIQNRIVLAEFESLRFNYQNLAVFETHGFNLSGEYKWKDKFKLSAGYAYTRLYNVWSEFSDVATFIPLPEWSNELSFTIPKAEVFVVLTHRYIGQQTRFFTGSDGNVEQGFIGDYHFLNATLSKSFWKDRITLAAGGKNLLNTQAVPSTAGGGGAHSGGGTSTLINWGRNYFVRLNVRLSRPSWKK